MSHFSKLSRANITSAEAFESAAKELGFTDVRKNVKIADYAGKMESVDVAAKAPGAQYDVAIKKNEAGKFDLISDWWGIRTRDAHLYPVMAKMGALGSDTDIQDALLRTTTKHAIMATYRRQGFMARVTEDATHNLTVTLTR